MNRIKKILCGLLALQLILVSFTVSADTTRLTGDADGNGVVNTTDALLVLRHAVGKITLSDEAKAVCDVNGDGTINTTDALQILQYAVKKRDYFDVDLTPEELYYKNLDKKYDVDYSDFSTVTIQDYTNAQEVTDKLGNVTAESATDSYSINSDGMLIYNPLSKSTAKEMDAKYSSVAKTTGTLKSGNTTLTYSVPKTATAYDCVPVEYTLTSDSSSSLSYVEATGYEDADRFTNGSAFDCTLPGSISVKLDYEGYVDGTTCSPSQQPSLALNPTNDVQGTGYPNYTTGELTNSGTVQQAEYTWYKFKYTNTGNTVLDGEGNGGFNFYCVLLKKNDDDGLYQQYATTPNGYQPLLDYLYPGESGEMWLTFNYGTPLPVGDYKIVVTGQLKNVKGSYSYSDTLLYQTNVTKSTFAFSVASNATVTTPNTVNNKVLLSDIARNGWIGTFEEFLTSYNTHKSGGTVSGKLYLQVASFTDGITLRAESRDGSEHAAVRVPVAVESDSISITLNPYNENYHINEDGTRTPLVITQNMCDMRGNVDRGPDTASTIVNELKNMKEAGINYITTTESAVGDYTGFYDMTMLMLDCARKMGFDLEGSALYPYRNSLAETRLRKLGYTDSLGANRDIAGIYRADAANGVLARINMIRYGDMYYSAANGTLPISIEDNFGWLGFYLNMRYAVGSTAFDRPLRLWLTSVYGTIDKLNAAYGSDYASFDDIDPSAEGTDQGNGSIVSNQTQNTYHDWTKATIDMDLFRTVQHADYYKIMLNYMGVSDAKINARSENAIYLASGISPDTKNIHYRSCYYEQRRAALVPEILASSGVFYGDSSYCALAYSPSEVYELTRQAAKSGFNTTKTAEFHIAYDTVVNSKYGDYASNANYNLDSNQRMCNIVSTVAVFPYWKALYEAGGVPGTMWMDYGCDTLVTSTQYKEICFFNSKVKEMLATKEGKAWSESTPSQTRNFDSLVVGASSYPDSKIEQYLTNIPRYNRILEQHS